MKLEKNEGEVHILVNCPIDTFLKEKQHSAMRDQSAGASGLKIRWQHLATAPLFDHCHKSIVLATQIFAQLRLIIMQNDK